MTRYNKVPKWENWCTPDWVIKGLVEAVFPLRIGLDPCACLDRESIARVNWYGPNSAVTDAQDGLKNDWNVIDPEEELVFCNPPYGKDLELWTAKAADEVVRSVVLCPPRVGSRWFHQTVFEQKSCSYIFFFKGRIQFENPPPLEVGKKKRDGNDSDSCLLFYNFPSYPIDSYFDIAILEKKLGGRLVVTAERKFII